jgi:hypothetical protein
LTQKAKGHLPQPVFIVTSVTFGTRGCRNHIVCILSAHFLPFPFRTLRKHFACQKQAGVRVVALASPRKRWAKLGGATDLAAPTLVQVDVGRTAHHNVLEITFLLQTPSPSTNEMPNASEPPIRASSD